MFSVFVNQYIGELFGQSWYRFGPGACHGDELFAMFVATKLPFLAIGTKEDLDNSQIMVTLWTNFVKYHDPTPNKEFGVRWPR